MFAHPDAGRGRTMNASPRDYADHAHSVIPAIPTTDPHTIGAFWDAMTEPGHVYEVRILCKGRTGPLGLKDVASGYFDDRQAFIGSVSRISGADATGVYLTMNPVDPALLSRSPNRIAIRAVKTTLDENIARRRRFLIDIDAANAPGSSATNEERAAALACRDEVHTYLQGLGWNPARVVTCSGNGGGLQFEIDLPNDEASRHLIKRCLEALHTRFTTPAATVDVANSNAARITRIPGTVTAKGNHTVERPWRRATATYPDGAGVVTRAQLESLAAQAPTTTRAVSTRGSAAGAGGGVPLPADAEGDSYAALLANGSTAGRRHHDMTRLVGHFIKCGLSRREIAIILRPWVDRCQPSFPHHELDTTIRDLAEAEARKQARADDVPGLDDTPPTLSAAAKELIATQRAQIVDLKTQVKAWEHLFTNRAIPDKAKRVLVHMHKRFGIPVGRDVPDNLPCSLYADEQDLQAEGFAISAYKEGRDILLSLGLVTRLQVMKQAPTPEPGDDIAARRARARGKNFFYKYALCGPPVNALWSQLPAMTEIAPTERQVKAVESRKERLERAIEEEKPTLHVVRALKREVAEVRQDRQNVVFEYRAVTQERDNAREQAEAAARERDRALEDAQRIIRAHQQPAAMLGCKGCGTRIDLDTWRCDDCRAREREDAFGDSKLDVNLESNDQHTVVVTNRLTSNFESGAPPDTFKKPCYGGCGTLTTNGYTCKACREGPSTLLHIQTGSALGQQEARHDR